nr:discoidin, CUB and LCCL domain-containing protein 2-like [Cavia porcellus]
MDSSPLNVEGAVCCRDSELSQNNRIYYGDGCGHTVRGPESATLASINYPPTYPSSTLCKWEIRVKMGERIRVKLGDVDIEDSDSCHFNYLRIYNEIGLGRTEIVQE